MLTFTEILGVKITTSSKEEVLSYIVEELSKTKKSREQVIIFTPNPEQISVASKDADLKAILNQADISLPDGVGILMGARLLGKPIEARITGVDFMKTLVKRIAEKPVVTGFLGGQPGVAEEAANCLSKMHSNLAIGYASDAYDKEKMMRSDIDILFVGLGFPKQERWILEHKKEIPASVIMAVGGSLDFISGRVPRAPQIFRTFGLEWLFRLAIQPWRFGRQLQIWHFGGLILQEALTNRKKD